MKSGEFGFIEQLAKFASSSQESLLLQDDGAIISSSDKRMVFVKDLIQAGIHTLKNDPLCDIVRKSILVNLSDLAAMGASPKYIMLGLCLTKDIDAEELFIAAEAIKTECEKFSLSLIGGDTIVGSGPITVSVTAIGQLQNQPILRSTACIGDDIWVSGYIGDAALALRMLLDDKYKSEFACHTRQQQSAISSQYYWPEPRIDLGVSLSGIASAMIDISDGLIVDAQHICDTSSVGLALELEAVPLSGAFRKWSEQITDYNVVASVLTGGDDYELLFTAPVAHRQQVEGMALKSRTKVTRIGKVASGDELLITRNGEKFNPIATGFTHF